MMTYLYIFMSIYMASCGQTKNNNGTNPFINAETVGQLSKDDNSAYKSVKFLWREDRYDSELEDTLSTIIINKKICKSLTDPERAALGYVVTFIGSECDWYGGANEDLSNLNCKALTALNLGFQCSETHLGFLKRWFKYDQKALADLEGCSIVPYTATVQNTFNYINFKTEGNNISIAFGASEINMRKGESWSWTETAYFQFDQGNIKLLKKEKSKLKRDISDTGK